jgi:uncharacterized protein
LRLRVRVAPRSKADEIVGPRPDGALLIRVRAAPEGGRANEAVLALLRKLLGVPRGSVRLAGGGASRDKWIEIDGVDPDEARRRLLGTR